MTSTHITPISLPFLGAFFLFLFYYASNTYFSFLLLKISVNYWRTRVTSTRLHNDVDTALTKQHPFALLPPTAMVKKSRPFCLTLSHIKITVLHPSGPTTTSASLIKIRQDCINAEHQIDDEIHSKLLYTHFLTIADWILDKRLTMLTEVSLETGMGFSEMEDKGFAPSRDYNDGSPKPASPEESDWDSDASNKERDPQSQKYHKAGNIYSAYTWLHLYNKYDVCPVTTILLIFFQLLKSPQWSTDPQDALCQHACGLGHAVALSRRALSGMEAQSPCQPGGQSIFLLPSVPSNGSGHLWFVVINFTS